MRTLLILVVILQFGTTTSCKDESVSQPDDEIVSVDLSSLDVNRDEQIEIITWNIEQFPKSGDISIQRAADIINGVNADIYALQEIRESAFFQDLLEKCPGYEGVLSEASQFIKPAVIYKSAVLDLVAEQDLFSNAGGDTSRNFASRNPIRVEFLFNGTFPLTLINFHLKAFDDEESEARRLESIKILHNYTENRENSSTDSNFVLLGDWNDDFDDLSDTTTTHPLYIFWQDSLDFRFLTYQLATDDDESNDSYPNYSPPSFLDHILISDALFDEAQSGEVRTLQMDQHLDSYFSVVSDHYPVMWTFTP
ncbi:MAG: hypothetical protein GF372_01605 [Candidatus Marinimicrobia bacterium]|nr:hypothetical protein [Candidatus Neomarinimicrobiota bacterium]